MVKEKMVSQLLVQCKQYQYLRHLTSVAFWKKVYLRETNIFVLGILNMSFATSIVLATTWMNQLDLKKLRGILLHGHVFSKSPKYSTIIQPYGYK